MNLLTDFELFKLTGAKQPNKQSDILDRNGIYYIRRLDGSIVTTWHHVNHPCARTVSNDDTPDFGAIA